MTRTTQEVLDDHLELSSQRRFAHELPDCAWDVHDQTGSVRYTSIGAPIRRLRGRRGPSPL